MKELVYPDGEVLKYTYDAGGLLQSATGFKDRVTYNYLNYLGYDHFGQRVYMELGNKTKTRYQYDPLTRRMSNLQTEGKDGKLQDIAYTYDDVGNILSITDSARNSVTQNFTYDGLYRLVAADGTYDSSRSPDGRTHTYNRKYRYDDIHNMIEKRATSEVNTKSGGTRYPKDQNYILEFEYNSDNPHQLAKVTESDPRGVRKNSIDVYTFDSAGNLESKLSNTDGKRRDLKWSAENRLQEVHQHGNIQKYTYNADGERIKKEGNNGESIYVNQFYHVRNSLLSFKHIYAGNTRIATKVVPSGNRPHKNRTQGGNQNQINVVGDPMQLDTAKVNKQLNLNGNDKGNTNNNQGKNTNDQNNKGNNGNKGNSGNNNGNNGNNAKQHDDTDVVIPTDCAFPIDQVKGNVTQTQVDNWCRRNAGINPNRGNAWGRNNNTNNSQNQNGNKEIGVPSSGDQQSQTQNNRNTGNNNSSNNNAGGNGQGPVNAQGNAYAYGWYANKDEYRTPPGKSRGKGTTGLKEPKIYFYHSDHLGSANYVTDVIGEVFEHTINFPFGEIWIDEGSNTSLLGFKFTGKELDEETGYIYFGARYYNPKVSVWVSTDPALPAYIPSGSQLFFPEESFNASSLKGAGGVYASINANLYHYARLNPVKLIDPNGLFSVDGDNIIFDSPNDTLYNAAKLGGYDNWQDAADAMGVRDRFDDNGNWIAGSKPLVGMTLKAKQNSIVDKINSAYDSVKSYARKPDYISMSVFATLPKTKDMIGLGANVTIDRYGSVYGTFGSMSIGKPGPEQLSVSVMFGWLFQKSQPAPSEVSDFLIGKYVNFTYGGIFGADLGWGITCNTSYNCSLEMGFATPQAGIAFGDARKIPGKTFGW